MSEKMGKAMSEGDPFPEAGAPALAVSLASLEYPVLPNRWSFSSADKKKNERWSFLNE